MSCFGIILDGKTSVGVYSFHCCEDSYSRRVIKNLQIKTEYFDVAKNRSHKLRFMYVEETNSGYRLVDDLGLGTVELIHPFISEIQAKCREAIFRKTYNIYEN